MLQQCWRCKAGMPPSFQYCSRCGIILKELSTKKKNIKTTEKKGATLRIEQRRPLSPTPTDLPPDMENQMMKLVNREGNALNPSFEKELIGNIQLLELEMASVIDSVLELNEKSNSHERKSFHTFHPDSIILPTIAIQDGKGRNNVSKPNKLKKINDSRLSHTAEGDYLSHIAPISIYYNQYVEREKLLKGLHAMAIDDDVANADNANNPPETKSLPPSEQSLTSEDSENASAWLWGSLGSVDENGSVITYTDDISFVTGELNSGGQVDESNCMFWGDIGHDGLKSASKEFDDKDIEDEIKTIEKEEFSQQFFNLFGYYPTSADLPDEFQMDSDGVPTSTAENYAKEKKMRLVKEASIQRREMEKASSTHGEEESQQLEETSQIQKVEGNIRGAELQKIKELYNRSMKAITKEIDRISIDLRIDLQKQQKYFIRDLRNKLLITEKVIESAAQIEADVQVRYEEFKLHSSQRRSSMAMEVATAMSTAAQVESTYREKYDLAAQAFKERETGTGNRPKLSTQRHIVSSKQMDAIKEKAETEMKRHGLIIQDLQSAESQLLLQIRNEEFAIVETMKVLFARHSRTFNKLLFAFKRAEGVLRNASSRRILQFMRENY